MNLSCCWVMGKTGCSPAASTVSEVGQSSELEEDERGSGWTFVGGCRHKVHWPQVLPKRGQQNPIITRRITVLSPGLRQSTGSIGPPIFAAAPLHPKRLASAFRGQWLKWNLAAPASSEKECGKGVSTLNWAFVWFWTYDNHVFFQVKWESPNMMCNGCIWLHFLSCEKLLDDMYTWIFKYNLLICPLRHVYIYIYSIAMYRVLSPLSPWFISLRQHKATHLIQELLDDNSIDNSMDNSMDKSMDKSMDN